jgi:hypothetical protein
MNKNKKESKQKKLKKEEKSATIPDAWTLIFQRVEVEDLLSLCLVQKSFWNKIRSDEDIWKAVFINEHGPCENLCKRDTWKARCLRRNYFAKKNLLNEENFVSTLLLKYFIMETDDLLNLLL